MSFAEAIFGIRRAVNEVNMEHMPEVVLLFRDPRSKTYFEEMVRRDIHRNFTMVDMRSDRLRIAGINVTIGSMRD